MQFRAVDAAGNFSAWTPATRNASDTVMIDRTKPTLPGVSGVPGACTAGPVTLTASGASDGGSGLDHYESMVGTGSVITRPSVVISAHGTSTVKFRSVDGVGNASAWVTNSVCLS